MKKKLLTFVLLMSCVLLWGQKISLEGQILKKGSNEPLEFVNIGFVGMAVGTVSDEDGYFELTYAQNKISPNDILQVSSIGFKTLRLKASTFYTQIIKNKVLYLESEPYALDEVFLSNDVRVEKRIGYRQKSDKMVGYWLNREALGGEIATKISIRKKNTKLKDLNFSLVKNNSGDIKIRVNVYDLENGLPGKNLLNTNIYHTISNADKEVSINLDPYNVFVDEDIIVSIELIKVYGTYVDFVVAGSPKKGLSFTRHLSQDQWKIFPGMSMAFSLNTSVPTKKKEEEVVRDIPEKITVYWDASFGMDERNLSGEYDLLKRYLRGLKNAQVEVVKFRNTLSKPRIFKVENGKSEAIVDYLRSTLYDGAKNYSHILKENEFGAQTILVFTDGIGSYESLKPVVYIPTFFVNSRALADEKLLQEAAQYADGHYINLNSVKTKTALNLMMTEVEDQTEYSNFRLSSNKLKGRIVTPSGPAQGASIRVKNTFIETQSDVDGKFEINASDGDQLVVNYLGMLEKELTISNQDDVSVQMKPEGEILDEVFLEAEAEEEEEIVTHFGKRKEASIAYDTKEITKEDIKSSHQTLDQLVIKLPGVIIDGVGADRKYRLPRTMLTSATLETDPIIVIDGMVYFQQDGIDNLPPIDTQTIESIKVIKSVIGTNRYGAAGAYGAIEIRTTATSFESLVNKEPEKTALVKGNDYSDQNVQLIGVNNKKPSYINQLELATSYDEALEIYKNQKRSNLQKTIPYYIDVSEYFMKWDQEFAYSVLTNIATIANQNVKALKALAFKMEALGKLEDAMQIYERLVRLTPKQEQPYRDLARIYVEVGAYEKAMDLYRRMLGNAIEGVQFTGLQKVIESELQNLLAFHRTKVNYSDIPNELRSADFKYDLRIVFDWNDSNTEFELQFVNPSKKFYSWGHTKFNNKARILDELNKGYHTEEFIIDDAEPGQWIINLECLSKESMVNPTYLKYTVYKNYGLPNETKEIKVIKLYQQQSKVTLDTFMIQ